MDPQVLWTAFFVILTFGVYISIAIWSRVATTDEFYVAGHHVHPMVNGMATAADWMSAASFLSMAGLIAFLGYAGSYYLMGWTGGYVLLALLLAPYLRKFNKFTVPDFIGDRYYSNIARVVAVICAIFVSFTYITGQMNGVGIAFSSFLGIDVRLGVIIGGIIVLFYAGLGGMKGITYTQVAQYCVLIFAYMVPAFFISFIITGAPVPQLGFIGEFKDEGVSVIEKLDRTLVDLGFTEYTQNVTSKLDVFAITASLMIGTAGLPHVIIRFFTVPKASDARLSAGWALLFIAILYTTAPAVGAFARLNFIDTVNETTYVAGENHEADAAAVTAAGGTPSPQWFSDWERTGLIGFEDQNGDGVIQYRGPNAADGLANEVIPLNRDIFVLANPQIAQLPAWVIGLVVAGGLAAALSTAAGLLLVISSSISHDLCRRVLFKNMNDKQELLAARIAAVAAVSVAIYAGMNPPDFVAAVVAFAFGLAAASFFPAIFLGIFWKRMNKWAAIIGMVVGFTFTAAYIVHFKLAAIPGLPAGQDAWLFGISPEGIGLLGALINFALAIPIALVTAPPPKDVQDLVEEIRIPRERPPAPATA
ncbi:MAG: cation acetate symporter [Maricaulaceae bacterium]|jgi:cation/acetate symporter